MRTKRTVGAVLALLLLSVGLVACGSDDNSSAKASSPGTSASDEAGEYGGSGGGAAEGSGSTLSIKDFAFSPSTLKVEKGTEVKVTNDDSTTHTWTFDDYDSGDLAPGKSAEHTFDEAGSFSFHCKIHPNMKGTIEVS